MSDHRGAPPSVDFLLTELERLVGDAKAVPLSASVMVNRAEIEQLTGELRDALPDELAQARWLVKERDAILEHAQSDADRILGDARSERDRLVSQQEIVRASHDEAARVIGEASEHARQLRLEAEDYVDAKLANFEVVLQKTLAAVERGRQKLRGRLDTDQLAEDYHDEDDDRV
jgi:cell division septum initiation protein DivIVA